MLADQCMIDCWSDQGTKEEQKVDLESTGVCLDQWSHPRGRGASLEQRGQADLGDSDDQ